MINLNQAILHTFNLNINGIHLAENVLQNTNSLNNFLVTHLEAALKNQRARKGLFYEDSASAVLLQKYLAGELNFVILTQQLAQMYFDAIKQAVTTNTVDLFCCEFAADGKNYFAIMKYTAQSLLAANPSTENSAENSALPLLEVIPNSTAKLEEFAIIAEDNLELILLPLKYDIDGNHLLLLPEAILECTTNPSPHEAIKVMQKAAAKVAKNFGADPMATSTAVKRAITSELDNKEGIAPAAAAKEIFPDNEEMQAAYTDEISAKGITKEQTITVDKEKTMKKMLRHKLKTDNGIELTIPLEYLKDADFIEFGRNVDGSINIILKHINSITNNS